MFNTGKIIIGIELYLSNDLGYFIEEDDIEDLSIINLSQCYGLSRDSYNTWYECNELVITLAKWCTGLKDTLYKNENYILWATIRYEDQTECIIEPPFSLFGNMNIYQQIEVNNDDSFTITIKK